MVNELKLQKTRMKDLKTGDYIRLYQSNNDIGLSKYIIAKVEIKHTIFHKHKKIVLYYCDEQDCLGTTKWSKFDLNYVFYKIIL